MYLHMACGYAQTGTHSHTHSVVALVVEDVVDFFACLLASLLGVTDLTWQKIVSSLWPALEANCQQRSKGPSSESHSNTACECECVCVCVLAVVTIEGGQGWALCIITGLLREHYQGRSWSHRELLELKLTASEVLCALPGESLLLVLATGASPSGPRLNEATTNHTGLSLWKFYLEGHKNTSIQLFSSPSEFDCAYEDILIRDIGYLHCNCGMVSWWVTICMKLTVKTYEFTSWRHERSEPYCRLPYRGPMHVLFAASGQSASCVVNWDMSA